MTQIFLYTDEAEISEESMKLLRENGYIPIRVAREDAVRILPPPLPTAQLDAITNAALRGCLSSEFAYKEFGKALAESLISRRPEDKGR